MTDDAGRFLHRLYEKAEGKMGAAVPVSVLQNEFGFAGAEMDEIKQELGEQLGYVVFELSGSAMLTPTGFRYISGRGR